VRTGLSEDGAAGTCPGILRATVLFEVGGTAENPALFAMTLIDGQSYAPLLDITDAPPAPETVAARACAAARMLGFMQNLDLRKLGIDREPA